MLGKSDIFIIGVIGALSGKSAPPENDSPVEKGLAKALDLNKKASTLPSAP